MQFVSSRIWTRVTVSISYEDNHYTTGTSKIKMNKYIYIYTVCYISTSVSQKFYNILVDDTYGACMIWPKLWKVAAVVSSNEVVGALTRYALLHFVCDLKATQINVQYRLTLELMIYKFKLGYDAMERNHKHLLSERRKCSWSQMMFRLQEPQRWGKGKNGFGDPRSNPFFHFILMPFEKARINLCSSQFGVNSRADWLTCLGEEKFWF